MSADAKAAIEALSNGELGYLLCAELDRRRLDSNGNPADPPGLYEATTTGLMALLGVQPNVTIYAGPSAIVDDAEALRTARTVKHLAAVGRGFETRPSPTAEIREVAQYVETVVRKIAGTERAAVLASLLQRQRSEPVAAEKLVPALNRYDSAKPWRLNGVITDVVIALSIYPKSKKRDHILGQVGRVRPEPKSQPRRPTTRLAR